MCHAGLWRCCKCLNSEGRRWGVSDLHVLPHRPVLGQDAGGVERGGGNNHGLLQSKNTGRWHLDVAETGTGTGSGDRSPHVHIR